MAEKKYLVNDEITCNRMLVIDEEGNPLGELTRLEALYKAEDAGLDLVLMSDNGKIPVCKIVNYGKFIYNMQKKEKANKKSQGELKEIRLSLSISDHDMQTKVKSANKFLAAGNKVKVVLRFRGREIVMVEEGKEVLQLFINKTDGVMERVPKVEGRTLSCILKGNNYGKNR